MFKEFLKNKAPILYDREYTDETGKRVIQKFRLLDIRQSNNEDYAFVADVFSLATQKIWRKPIYCIDDDKYIMYIGTKGGPYFEVKPYELIDELRDKSTEFYSEFITNLDRLSKF